MTAEPRDPPPKAGADEADADPNEGMDAAAADPKAGAAALELEPTEALEEMDADDAAGAAPKVKLGAAEEESKEAPLLAAADPLSSATAGLLAPKEKGMLVDAAVEPSVLPAGLAPKAKVDDEPPLPDPDPNAEPPALPKVNVDEMGALPPVGAAEPKPKGEAPVPGVATGAAAGGFDAAGAAVATGARPSAASSASSSLLPVDSNPTSFFSSAEGHTKPPVTQPFLRASSAFLSALGSFFLSLASAAFGAASVAAAAGAAGALAGFAEKAAGVAPNVVSLACEESFLVPKMGAGALAAAAVLAAGLEVPKVKPDDAGVAGAPVPNLKPPDTPELAAGATVALEPNVKAEGAAAALPASAGAPGLGSSHDMHLTLASALFRVIHFAQSHSPGLALNMSASDGKDEEVAVGSAGLEGAGAFTPKLKEPAVAVPPALGAAGAPGLGSSHDMHLTLASALFRVIHFAQSHSPGLGLNMSASDGKAEEVAADALLDPELVPKQPLSF
jgi:hypothetical protein